MNCYNNYLISKALTFAGKEPFPTIYVDSQKDGEVHSYNKQSKNKSKHKTQQNLKMFSFGFYLLIFVSPINLALGSDLQDTEEKCEKVIC